MLINLFLPNGRIEAGQDNRFLAAEVKIAVVFIKWNPTVSL